MIDPTLQRTIDGLFRYGDRDDSRGELWDTLLAHGLIHPFAHGAERWSEGGAIVHAASRHAPGFGLAENIAGSFLLARNGHELGPHRLTLADPLCSELVLDGGRVRGRMAHVPHAAVSSHVLAVAHSGEGPSVVCLELRGAEGESAQNIAGEPRDLLTVHGAPITVLNREASAAPSSLLLVGALLRAAQIAALGESVLELSLEHGKARKQFGRPIGEQQAVEQQLAELACDVALGTCAVRFAEARLDGTSLNDESTTRAIAQAKIVCGRLAETAVRVGHAVLGALGFSDEHALSRCTARLMSYPAEYGGARYWAEQLGAQVIHRGASALWPDLVRLSE